MKNEERKAKKKNQAKAKGRAYVPNRKEREGSFPE